MQSWAGWSALFKNCRYLKALAFIGCWVVLQKGMVVAEMCRLLILAVITLATVGVCVQAWRCGAYVAHVAFISHALTNCESILWCSVQAWGDHGNTWTMKYDNQRDYLCQSTNFSTNHKNFLSFKATEVPVPGSFGHSLVEMFTDDACAIRGDYLQIPDW